MEDLEEYVFKFPYEQEQWVRPKYHDESDRIYNDAFLNPEVIRLRKKIIHNFIYKTYDTGWKPLTGDVEVLIDIRCRRNCNLLFAGKNIIDALWSEYEQIIKDDRQVISAKITQRHYKQDVIRIGVIDLSNKRKTLSQDEALITFDTEISPCEILLPEFRRNTDKFIINDKNDIAIQRHVKHLRDNYSEYIRKPIRKPVSLSIDINSHRRKDIDNIALLLVLALKKADILSDLKCIKVLNLNLMRNRGIAEKAVIKLVC